MDDFEKVGDALCYEGYADNSSALAALARLEAEHKRLQERAESLGDRLEAAADVLDCEMGGYAVAEAAKRQREDNDRLRADSERLRKALRGTRLYDADTGPCWCPAATCLTSHGRQSQCAEWAALLEEP